MLSQEAPTFSWYASADGEVFTVGPCATRDEVVAEAVAEELGACQDEAGAWRLRFVLLEAARRPIDISRHLPVSLIASLLGERIDEAHNEDDESLTLDAWDEKQEEDLYRSLRLAVRQWQFRNGIVVTPTIFTDKRGRENVDVPLPPSNL